MTIFWKGKRVLVTGGSGFIGSHLIERLLFEGASIRACGRSKERFRAMLGRVAEDVEFCEGELRSADFCFAIARQRDAVFHLAGKVAGIGYNSKHPGTIFFENVILGQHILDAAARSDCERFLLVSTACVYRRHCPVPTPEHDGFIDDPEPTNLGYGWAKRCLEVQARCYAQEYSMKIGIARPYNAYGPRDNFEWETSHVIPALIRKCVECHDPLVVWGNGSQSRSFLYVSDFVEGLLRVLEHYPICDPVNIGSEEEITIGDLAKLLLLITGSKARLLFDAQRPAGQPRRNGDFSKAREKAGFRANVTLKDGLTRTVEWYVKNRAQCQAR